MTSPQGDDREGPHPPWCESERVILPHGSVRLTAGLDGVLLPLRFCGALWLRSATAFSASPASPLKCPLGSHSRTSGEL